MMIVLRGKTENGKQRGLKKILTDIIYIKKLRAMRGQLTNPHVTTYDQ